MKRNAALALTLSVSLACVAIVGFIGDLPVTVRSNDARPSLHVSQDTRPGEPGRRGALAIRDHVSSFQKWGTKMFTQPALERLYDDVAYFTLSRPLDQEASIALAFEQLATTNDRVDVFVLAHSNALYVQFAGLAPDLRQKLGLVYDTGCADAVQADAWLELGARVHVGHPGASSVSPLFYFYFLRRYEAGFSITDAVEEANAHAATRLGLLQPLFANPSLVEDTRAVFSGDGALTSTSPSFAGRRSHQ